MGNPVDELSDKAMGASKVARTTHSNDAHQEASKAHQTAFAAASLAGRPSLAQHHLQEAADHDAHTDPTTLEGKQAHAARASQKADASGDPKDHDAAQLAHEDARDAASERGMGKAQMKHDSQATKHQMKAHDLRKPPPVPMVQGSHPFGG
jgi:hypothetical protein